MANTDNEKQEDPLNKRFKTWLDNLLEREGRSVNERKELKRNKVRVWATHLAGLYLFVVIPIAAYLIFSYEPPANGDGKDMDSAKDLLLAVMPVASSILAFWFGARGKSG